MAERNLSEVLAQRGTRMRWRIALLFGSLMALQAGAFALVIGLIWGERVAFWLPELLIASVFLLVAGVLALAIVYWQQRATIDLLAQRIQQERDELTMAHNQASALKALAAALGSARDVDGLFDITLDIFQLALSEAGVPAENQVSAIYLLDDGHLSAVAAQGPGKPEDNARLNRHQGIIGRSLAQAELLVSQEPDRDPALSSLAWLKDSQQVLCAPLCTARGLYGLVLVASKQAVALSVDEQGFLEAIADQVAMALHSFQLQQDLAEVGLAHMAAEEDERGLVRQALHQGPSRTIAALALRLGLIRSLMIRDPAQAAKELAKMESQTRRASVEVKNLLSYLRPLDLGIKDFDRTVEAALREIEGELGMSLRIGRRSADRRLSPQTGAVILYVLEGSLAWANKRGQATAAEISYWAEEGHFYFSIDDDGRDHVQVGNERITRADDLATILMRSKVSRLGGRLEVTPRPSRGVLTVLVTPLNQPGLSPAA